jgi:AcrR family transcriptional regulator
MARPRSDIQPRLLHAARDRFLREGVDGASLRAIAEDAGTNIGMVYYYFPSKDDLFLAVVEQVYVTLLEGLERVLAPGLPVAERLAGLYRRLGELSDDERTMVRLVIREALASPARLDKLLQRFLRGHVPLLLALVRDGMAEELFDRRLHPAVVLAALVVIGGPAQQILLQAAASRLPLPVPPVPTGQALTSALVGVLLGGVGGGVKGSAPPAAAAPRSPGARPRRSARASRAR